MIKILKKNYRGPFQINILVILFPLMFGSYYAFSQSEISGEYTRTEYPRGYLILNTDYSFKYKFHFDLQWDIACGQYEIKGDTIIFHYSSDMFDSQCNDQRVNVTDTSGVILQSAIDTRFRPLLARFTKNKIILLQRGDIENPETIVKTVSYFYRRDKKRGKRNAR
jgi:hypothetical protein